MQPRTGSPQSIRTPRYRVQDLGVWGLGLFGFVDLSSLGLEIVSCQKTLPNSIIQIRKTPLNSKSGSAQPAQPAQPSPAPPRGLGPHQPAPAPAGSPAQKPSSKRKPVKTFRSRLSVKTFLAPKPLTISIKTLTPNDRNPEPLTLKP